MLLRVLTLTLVAFAWWLVIFSMLQVFLALTQVVFPWLPVIFFMMPMVLALTLNSLILFYASQLCLVVSHLCHVAGCSCFDVSNFFLLLFLLLPINILRCGRATASSWWAAAPAAPAATSGRCCLAETSTSPSPWPSAAPLPALPWQPSGCGSLPATCSASRPPSSCPILSSSYPLASWWCPWCLECSSITSEQHIAGDGGEGCVSYNAFYCSFDLHFQKISRVRESMNILMCMDSSKFKDTKIFKAQKIVQTIKERVFSFAILEICSSSRNL